MPRYVKIPVLLLLLVAAPARADVYKYVDANGMTIFSTVPLPGKTPIAVIGAQSSGKAGPVAPPVEHSQRASSGEAVYKYKDDDGRIVLSTVPLPGKTPIAVIPVEPSAGSSSRSSPSVASSAPSASAGNSSSSGSASSPYAASSGSEPSFKVSGQTQRGRDDLRRSILQDELTTEQKLLSTAETTYRDGQPVRLPEETANPSLFDDRVKRLADAIRIHRSNIVALQNELSRVK